MNEMQEIVKLLFGILFLSGVIDILQTNTQFITRKYSNGITIVKDRLTGDQYLIHKDATNMIKIESDKQTKK